MKQLPWQRIHLTGIGGVGMSGLAHILLDLGVGVSGTDLQDSETLEHLRIRGAQVGVGHGTALPSQVELLVYSSAVREDNPELQEAHDRALTTIRRGLFLAQLALHFETVVAVAGSHGKTTTTAMLAHILRSAGLDPGYLVGGTVIAFPRAATAGSGRILVTEVDESDGTQACMHSTHAVIVNIEDDHCWSVGGPEALDRCFADFAGAAGTVLAWQSEKAQALLSCHGAVRFLNADDIPQTLHLRTPGAHNRVNATLALNAAAQLGVAPDTALRALATFAGVLRRTMERYREPDGRVIVVEDYAHHPTELRACLATLRETYPEHRLLAVFQPHRFERASRYRDAFGATLTAADEVVVTRPFAAWLEGQGLAAARGIAAAAGKGADFTELDFAALAAHLAARLSQNTAATAVAIIGAGDVSDTIPPLADALADRCLDRIGAELAARLPELEMRRDRNWAQLTTLGIGRARPLLIRPPSNAALTHLLDYAAAAGIPITVIGAGTNLVGTDAHTVRLTVQCCRDDFARIETTGGAVIVGAGVPLRQTVLRLTRQGALPPAAAALAWIPGSIGGAVRMNAGAHGTSISEFVAEIRGVTAVGAAWICAGDAIGWHYRGTDIPPDVIITDVVLALQHGDPEEARRRYHRTGKERLASQPCGPSAGCIFRNPPGATAGYLLDRSDCKDLSAGGCRISSQHANFILAEADAGEADFLRLLFAAQRRVFRRTGVLLEPEVTFAGPESAARVAQHTEWLREEASRRPGQTAGTETTPR